MKPQLQTLVLALSVSLPAFAGGPMINPNVLHKPDMGRLGQAARMVAVCPKGWKTVVDRRSDPAAFRGENIWIVKCRPDVAFPRSVNCPQSPSRTYPVIDRERMEIGCKTSVR